MTVLKNSSHSEWLVIVV